MHHRLLFVQNFLKKIHFCSGFCCSLSTPAALPGQTSLVSSSWNKNYLRSFCQRPRTGRQNSELRPQSGPLTTDHRPPTTDHRPVTTGQWRPLSMCPGVRCSWLGGFWSPSDQLSPPVPPPWRPPCHALFTTCCCSWLCCVSRPSKALGIRAATTVESV